MAGARVSFAIEPGAGRSTALARSRAPVRGVRAGLGIDLGFQGFEAELAGLPGAYAPPGGRLLLARDRRDGGRMRRGPAARARHLRDEAAVRPVRGCRGFGLGRRLAEAAVRRGAGGGVPPMRLDTLPSDGGRRRALYRALGFGRFRRTGTTPSPAPPSWSWIFGRPRGRQRGACPRPLAVHDGLTHPSHDTRIARLSQVPARHPGSVRVRGRPRARLARRGRSGSPETVRADVAGNSFATLDGDGRPRVMLAGHIDEIGVMVSHIDDDGFVSFDTIGGWDPQVFVGQRVRLLGRAGSGRWAWWARRPSTSWTRTTGRRSPRSRISGSTSAPPAAPRPSGSSGSATRACWRPACSSFPTAGS